MLQAEDVLPGDERLRPGGLRSVRCSGSGPLRSGGLRPGSEALRSGGLRSRLRSGDLCAEDLLPEGEVQVP